MSFPLYGSRAPSNWQTVMRDSARSLRPVAVAFINAGGSYDLAAIMREAVRHARGIRSLPAWQRRMAVALRYVWNRAKAERLAKAH